MKNKSRSPRFLLIKLPVKRKPSSYSSELVKLTSPTLNLFLSWSLLFPQFKFFQANDLSVHFLSYPPLENNRLSRSVSSHLSFYFCNNPETITNSLNCLCAIPSTFTVLSNLRSLIASHSELITLYAVAKFVNIKNKSSLIHKTYLFLKSQSSFQL